MPDDAIRIDAELVRQDSIPSYLQDTYWWAYVHPNAVSVFERQWLVNLILWGNFSKLRDAALDELGTSIGGRNLQVACVYGDFTPKLNARLSDDGWLDVVDVLPIQLSNLRTKLPVSAHVTPLLRNSAHLGLADDTYDQSILFFLLHEQPEEVRRQTLAEVVRVTKPGGRIVIVDYHQPRHPHPLRYLFGPILNLLEPFAMDLWRSEVLTWLPSSVQPEQIRKETYFGGLYQKLVITL